MRGRGEAAAADGGGLISTMKTEINSLQSSSVTHLPPGKYWVTDPCYVYPESEWMDYCNNCDSGMKEYDGVPFFGFGTAYGDGEYELLQGAATIGSCGVDAGLLAIIPDALVAKWGKRSKEELKGLGVAIDLMEPTAVHESGGDVQFGRFSLETS
jgi:hypothetical protein